MRKEHNYPASRKSRDTSYAMSYKLCQAIGDEKLGDIFSKAGMYIAAKQITEIYGEEVSPYVTRYLCTKLNGVSNESIRL